MTKIQACIDARRALMDQCFDGGDARHREHMQQLDNAHNRCLKFLERCLDDEGCHE